MDEPSRANVGCETNENSKITLTRELDAIPDQDTIAKTVGEMTTEI